MATNRCPQCGSKVTLRVGKFGAFYGCSRWPKCRFTARAEACDYREFDIDEYDEYELDRECYGDYIASLNGG